MVTEVGKRPKHNAVPKPRFRSISELTEEQLTDPDYSLKQLARETGISENQMIICSKCHHCR